MKSKFRHGEIAEFSVTPKRDAFLTIFSLNLEKQAVAFPFENGKKFRRLRAGEKFGKKISLTIENAGEFQEKCQLVFVLTKNEPKFRAAGESEVFPRTKSPRG